MLHAIAHNFVNSSALLRFCPLDPARSPKAATWIPSPWGTVSHFCGVCSLLGHTVSICGSYHENPDHTCIDSLKEVPNEQYGEPTNLFKKLWLRIYYFFFFCFLSLLVWCLILMTFYNSCVVTKLNNCHNEISHNSLETTTAQKAEERSYTHILGLGMGSTCYKQLG